MSRLTFAFFWKTNVFEKIKKKDGKLFQPAFILPWN